MPFNYEKRYVAFFDILGFKAKVARIEQHTELFELLLSLPKIISSQVAQANEIFGAGRLGVSVDVQGTAFSDNVVISASWSEDRMLNLYAVIEIANELSKKLLEAGALVRGGIALGPTYHREGIVFGQGMVDAYNLEHDLARVPRIIVSPDVAAVWRDNFGRPGSLTANLGRVARDHDGLDFVDIFHFPENDTWHVGTNAFFVAAAKELALMLSNRSVPLDVWAKIVWLAQRYNNSNVVARRKFANSIAVPEYK